MVLAPVSEILVGIYLGVLAGFFPALIAFAIGFGFRYFTDVTVPGLGVVVLGGALAGISGGLMGLVDPALAESWTGITAILVVLMLCLWAHSQGDKLAIATPRRLTLGSLKSARVSENLASLVDAYGQIKIRPFGEIQDMEGYPPLPDELRAQLAEGAWRFPAKLSRAELEARLEERLITEHELAEADVTIDAEGRAEIAAAPPVAGLSRRIPSGKRGVSVKTLLPAGMTRGETATLRLPSGDVTGTVVSAHTASEEVAKQASSVPPAGPTPVDADQEARPIPATPTTSGGEGQVTVAVPLEEAKRVLRAKRAPMHVEARGKQREHVVVDVLREAGHRFRKVRVPEDGSLVGGSLAAHRLRGTYGVAVLTIRRPGERIVAPTGDTTLAAGDELIVVGQPADLDRFEQEALA